MGLEKQRSPLLPILALSVIKQLKGVCGDDGGVVTASKTRLASHHLFYITACLQEKLIKACVQM